MKQITRSNAFRKDYKRVLKRGFSEEKFIKILKLIAADRPLPQNCRPHKLSGEYTGMWECHITPDWLLIYEVSDEEVALRRTGTHADLFR